MIDLTRIRDIGTLEDIKNDLTKFLSDPDIKKTYTNTFGWGEEDYDADKELAQEFLDKVNRRIASLSRLLARSDSSTLPKLAPPEVPSEQ